MARIRCLDRCDAALDLRCLSATVALERELHVGGRDGCAVVELGIFAKNHVVDELVIAHVNGFGQAWCQAVAGHRLYHRIVDGIEHHVGRYDAGSLRRIEPGRSERDMNRPGDLTLGTRGPGRMRDAHHQSKGEKRRKEAMPSVPPAKTLPVLGTGCGGKYCS